MKYTIHNKHLILPESQLAFFEEEVERRVKMLDNVLRGYRKAMDLDIFVKVEGKRPESYIYRITVSLPLKGKPLVVEGTGVNAMLVIIDLLDTLRNQINTQLEITRREHLYKQKDQRSEIIQRSIDQLALHSDEEEQGQLVQFLTESLATARNYIRRRLMMARATGLIKNKQVSPADLLDEAYIRLYRLCNSKPDAAENIQPWMYQVVDDVLEETLHEKEYELKHGSELEKIVRGATRGLEKKFGPAADPDLAARDERLKASNKLYVHQYYSPAMVLKDGSARQAYQRISGKEDDKHAHKIISAALAGMPSLKRSVFDLHHLEGLSPEDLAFVKRLSVEEVEALLGDTGRQLGERLLQHAEV